MLSSKMFFTFGSDSANKVSYRRRFKLGQIKLQIVSIIADFKLLIANQVGFYPQRRKYKISLPFLHTVPHSPAHLISYSNPQ